MKKFLFSAAVCALLLMNAVSCASHKITLSESVLAEARNMLSSNRASCVLIRNDEIINYQFGGGVSPLLTLYDSDGERMEGNIIVDKVIGRAAASIIIVAKVRYVFGEVMSEDAIEFLAAHKVRYGYTLKVPRILNKKRDGLCPLEKSVEGINDPEQALKALRAKIAAFQKKQN